MLNLLFTKFNSKGFVFSFDAALSVFVLLLVSSLIISSFIFSSSFPSINLKHLTDSGIEAMFKSGFLLDSIDSNPLTVSAEEINNKISSFLPKSINSRIELKQYDLNKFQCREFQSFEECFPQDSLITSFAGKEIPENKEIISSRKVYLKYQPPAECDLNYSIELKETDSFDFLLFQEKNKKIFFEESFDDFLIDFNLSVTPSDAIICGENVDINLSVSVPEMLRKPVDVMMVVDVSGSMSWGGRSATGDARSVVKQGNHVYVAAGTRGLRAVDVSNPLLPVISSTENSGTYIDVSVSGNTAFVADSSFFSRRITSVDISNPNNLTRLGQMSINSISGLYAEDNYVFVAGRRTFSNATRGLLIYDASNPGSLNYVSHVSGNSPQNVFVLGNYAFLADGTSGLKIIDVSNKSSPFQVSSINFSGFNAVNVFVLDNIAFVASQNQGIYAIDVTDKNNIFVLDFFNTPGTAADVFVSDNLAFVADGSTLQIIDVSNPSEMFFFEEYLTPYNYSSVWVDESYVFLATGSIGLVAFDWTEGTRIENAIKAGNIFLSSDKWDFDSDQMGLVTFSTSSNLEQELTHSVSDVNAALNALIAAGGTNTPAGIYTATDELMSSRANPNAIPFQVLLSDGETNIGDSTPAAEDAASKGIKIFAIGFGEDADEAELDTITSITGGKYYMADDVNALSEVYELIAKDIQEEATNASVSIPFFEGAIAVDLGGGELINENLVFEIGVLEPGEEWSVVYTLNFPCDIELNCEIDAITFPGEGASFIFTDSDGNTHSIDFNSSITLDFFKRDLTVEFFGGEIHSQNTVYLDVNVSNISELASDSTILNFYLNDLNTIPIHSETVPSLCGSIESNYGCVSNHKIFSPLILNSTGIIHAKINPDNSISECPGNNISSINCYEIPATQVIVIDYFVWR